jgi:hypothetical protein
MNERLATPLPRYPIWLVSLVGATLISALVLLFAPGAKDWFSTEKTYDNTLQFLFTTVLGAGIALFYRGVESRRAEQIREAENRRAENLREQEREREQIEARQSALDEFRRSLIETYHSTKKIRRTLRSVSFTMEDGKTYGCARVRFEQLMDQLEEAQLRTEALKEEVEARHDLFGSKDEKRKLKDLMNDAQDYLRGLLRYYEDNFSKRKNIIEADAVSLDKNLTDFIGRTKGQEGQVVNKYYHPIGDARELVIKMMENNLKTSSKANHN